MRASVIFWLLGVWGGLLALTYVLSSQIMLSSFEAQDARITREHTSRVYNILRHNLDALEIQVSTWAQRPDAYWIVSGRNRLLLEHLFSDESLNALQLDLFLVSDNEGKVLYGRVESCDVHPRTWITLDDASLATYLTFDRQAFYFKTVLENAQEVTGLATTPCGPLMISLRTVQLDEKDKPVGFLLMGRYLDSEAIDQLANVVVLTLEMHYLNDPALPPDFQTASARLTPDAPLFTQELDETTNAGYLLLNDVIGSPLLILRVSVPRDAYQQGRQALRLFMLGQVLSGLFFVIITSILLDRQVVARLLRLNRAVQNVSEQRDPRHLVPVEGHDELSQLARAINAMLVSLQEAHRSLATSQLQLQRVITSISDIIYTLEINPEGKVIGHTSPSPHIATLTGYPHSRFLADWRFWRELVHPEDKNRLYSLPRVLSEQAGEVEYRIITANEEVRWVRDSTYATVRLDGSATIYGVISDITARKQAELEREQLLAQTRARATALATVAEVSRQITTILDVEQLLWTVCELISTNFNLYHVQIFLLSEDEEQLRLVAGTGKVGRERVEQKFTIALQNPISLVARAARTRTVQVLNDVQHAEGHLPHPKLVQTRASLALPMIVGETLLGVLNVQARKAGRFGDADVQIQTTLAAQIAIAIHNARLFTAERKQRALAEALHNIAQTLNSTLETDEVLERILQNVGKVIPHDAASVMLLDEAEQVARVVGQRGFERYGLAEWWATQCIYVDRAPDLSRAIQSGRPQWVSDTHATPEWTYVPETRWIRSHVTVPIRQDDHVIGFLMLESTTPNFFLPEQEDVLRAFADQTALAIHNARLFAAEREQRALAEALRDSARAINSTLEIDEVFDRILQNLNKVVSYDVANVLLIEGDEVRVARRAPEPSTAEERAWWGKFRFRLSETPNLQRAIHAKQAFAVPEVNQYELWIDLPYLQHTRSHAIAPIRYSERTIGFLTVDSNTPRFYTEDHAERLQAFADQAAVAIRNAQLFATIQRHAVELEHRVQERTRELEARRAQLQVILDSITEGVIYDEDLSVKYINRAFTRLTGYQQHELRRYLGPLLAHSPEETETLTQEIYQTVKRHAVWQKAVRVRRKDGSEFDAELTVTEVRNANGKAVGAVSVLRDISREKALQEQKDRFLAYASHELRTPLANIKTRLYLLRRQPEHAEHHLAVLEEVANAMAELVESLLDITRFERGVIVLHPQTISIQALVQQVVNVQRAEAEAKGVTLITEMPETPLHVKADQPRMRQVITNLLMNALHYTPAGGQVCVSVAAAPELPDWVELRVQDTGPGIAPEHLPHIFEPFFRAGDTTRHGAGLGLTIVWEIVRLHGGTLDVESTLGQGSTFVVRLKRVNVAHTAEK